MAGTAEDGEICGGKRPYRGTIFAMGWRHSGVVEVVKRGLNDPGSFEHLQTSWMRGGGYPRTYIVIMDFTAKNSYGGRMRHVIRCEVEVETGEVAQVFSIE